MSTMTIRAGRPREHGEKTRRRLLAAAEELVAAGGPDALSVRSVAEAAGTTTRAVYTLFQSKDGLVTALATITFELLADACDEVPITDQPQQDVIDLGLRAFRPIVVNHPALYRIAFQRIAGLQPHPDLVATRNRAFIALRIRAERLAEAGLLGSKSVPEAMLEIEAMFEGLANTELRGDVLPIMASDPEHAWREGLATLIRGFASA